jgi:hypothetical protein
MRELTLNPMESNMGNTIKYFDGKLPYELDEAYKNYFKTFK